MATLYTLTGDCCEDLRLGNIGASLGRRRLEHRVSVYERRFGPVTEITDRARGFYEDLERLQDDLTLPAMYWDITQRYERHRDLWAFSKHLGPFRGEEYLLRAVRAGKVNKDNNDLQILPDSPSWNPINCFSYAFFAGTTSLIVAPGFVLFAVYGTFLGHLFYCKSRVDAYNKTDFAFPLTQFGDLLDRRSQQVLTRLRGLEMVTS